MFNGLLISIDKEKTASSHTVTDIHYSPPFSLRLLKVNNHCSEEDSEENKENSEDKEYCSDSKKEVGVCGFSVVLGEK